MGFLKDLLGGLAQNNPSMRNNGNSRDDYVSPEDYNKVQEKFREMYDAQQAGDEKKAQALWDKFKDETGYHV